MKMLYQHHRNSIRMALMAAIAMFCFISQTIAQDCYNKNRSNGIAAMQKKNYDKAIKLFELAKDCPDKPGNNDLDTKINECKRLKNQAIQEKKDAEKRKQEEEEARIREEEERQSAEKRRREEAKRRLSEGLVAYYPFEGSAHDESGNGNNGNVQGATLATGHDGQCYHFGGYDNSQIIQIPNSNSLKFTNVATFSFWFKLESSVGMDGYGRKVNYGGNMNFFAKNFDRGQVGAGINVIDDNSYKVYVYNDRDGYDATINGNPIGTWNHAVMVVTDSYFQIYINGNEVAKKYKTMNFNASNSCDLIIGRLAQTWYPFHGCIDEFRVYNRLLTEEEVRMLANGFYEEEERLSAEKRRREEAKRRLSEGLVAYYPFEGSAHDESGNGNNGNVQGATLATGHDGQCYHFGGYDNSQIIQIPNSNSLKFTNVATFSFWFKLESSVGMDGYGRKVNYGGNMNFFAKNFDRGQVGAGINVIDDNSYKVYVYNDRDGYDATINGNPIGTWNHAVMVVTDSYFQIYINGNEVAKKYKTMNFNASNSCDLIIGRLAQTWYPFHGCIDEFRVYNRLLTEEEIKMLANGF